MTPLQLEILIWYFGHADDYRDGDFSAPAVRETINAFRDLDGLIEPDQSPTAAYVITERGRVFVRHLMAQPLPEQRWIMPASVQQAASAAANYKDPSRPPLEKMARALGEHIHAAHQDDFVTQVRALRDIDGEEIPGTIAIAVDGEIDLIKLARAALQSLKDLDEGTVEAMREAWLNSASDCKRLNVSLTAGFTAAINHILRSGEP